MPFARHALAIDETRADFDRVPWGQQKGNRKKAQGEPEPFAQLWFAGNHSDIGGSYPEDESRLSDIALDWVIGEATSLPFPILVDASRLRLFGRANGMQHSGVESLFDRYPRWVPRWLRRGWGVKVRDTPMAERFTQPSISALPCPKCSNVAGWRRIGPRLCETTAGTAIYIEIRGGGGAP